ncbi:unnamed protein product [Cyprideis torosa]|uniref:Kinesin-like protein n=1 Tax=Cyprideis torosa TaxID=163714 RepID=A0A7R8ZSQ6_9CRUS|nr:unnamed protein product [Cyprideis torosa]CAG0906323.1 unnamed protein product [Cyprideis torosa]
MRYACRKKSRCWKRNISVEEKQKIDEGWRKSEAERRILQNQVLELKGNVRVFCRLRPPLANEPPEITAFQTPGPCEITCFPPGGKRISFTFDRVLNQHIQQEEAFEEVSALVQTALDGYKVCVFAYGQTGSGKTYTMEGDIDGPNRGIIPRATEQIFDTIEELKARDWSYEVKVSIFEVYNEKFTDLINPDENGRAPEIFTDKTTKEPVFVNLYRATAEKPSEVQTLIRRAQRRRHVAATKCNERSSRSHCVFWMQFSGKNSATEETTAGSVYLVDLAGSERSEVSGATGVRLQETNDINVSLSALDRVFVSIMAKDSHIPYRDSRLTHCLQPCLGGSAKVLMMVNLSPFDVKESLKTLRFGKKVNQCHIGTARKRC